MIFINCGAGCYPSFHSFKWFVILGYNFVILVILKRKLGKEKDLSLIKEGLRDHNPLVAIPLLCTQYQHSTWVFFIYSLPLLFTIQGHGSPTLLINKVPVTRNQGHFLTKFHFSVNLHCIEVFQEQFISWFLLHIIYITVI